MEQKRKLYGLVLAGGKSVRMGEDKSLISWHGKPQRLHMADLLMPLCSDVFISCRHGQDLGVPAPYKTLIDSIDAGGPIAGILSAFSAFPDVAWLVVACDLPLLDGEVLQELVRSADTSMLATVFRSPADGMPEPLIAIWEPGAAAGLRAHLENGFKCPRKFLINNSDLVLIIDNQKPESLLNANTPADRNRVLQLLHEGRLGGAN
ncbi:MAG: NTP transferase domain-containing protein [Taibaiella sp.]|nr:NTP transferase domain-containing protein [Taibaiella sp.]